MFSSVGSSSSSSSSVSTVITFEEMGLNAIFQRELISQGLTPAFLSTLSLDEYNVFIRDKSVLAPHVCANYGLTSGELPEAASQALRNFILKKKPSAAVSVMASKPCSSIREFFQSYLPEEEMAYMLTLFESLRRDYATFLKFENAEEVYESDFFSLFTLADQIKIARGIEIERSFEPGGASHEILPLKPAEKEMKTSPKKVLTPESALVDFFNRYHLFPEFAPMIADKLHEEGVTLDTLLQANIKQLKILVGNLFQTVVGFDNFILLHFALRTERRLILAATASSTAAPVTSGSSAIKALSSVPVTSKSPESLPSTDWADFLKKRCFRPWAQDYLTLLEDSGITLDLALELARLDSEELAILPLITPVRVILLYQDLLEELKIREAVTALREESKEESKESKEPVKIATTAAGSASEEATKLRELFLRHNMPLSITELIDELIRAQITEEILLNVESFNKLPDIMKTLPLNMQITLWAAIRKEQTHRSTTEALAMFISEDLQLGGKVPLAKIAPVKILCEYMGFFGEMKAADLKAARERAFISVPGGPPVKKAPEPVLEPVTTIDEFFTRYPKAIPEELRDLFRPNFPDLHSLLVVFTDRGAPARRQICELCMVVTSLKDAIQQENKVIQNSQKRKRYAEALAAPLGGPSIR